MKKIFLSLGFNGRTEEDVMSDIDNAKKWICSNYPEEEFEFVHNYDYIGGNRIECLGEAIKKMSTCDHVYFINDWFFHKGCMVEKKVCELYKIEHDSIVI